jgi:hypothetical protein
MPTKTVYLTVNENARVTHLAERYGVGVSTFIRIAVKSLLDDPLPEWAQAIAKELTEVSNSRLT